MLLCTACPRCGGEASTPLYEWPAVPTSGFLLINESSVALDFPAAPFRLHWCHACGFVFNSAWEAVWTICQDAARRRRTPSRSLSHTSRRF